MSAEDGDEGGLRGEICELHTISNQTDDPRCVLMRVFNYVAILEATKKIHTC